MTYSSWRHEANTKDLTARLEDRDFFTKKGDARIAMILPRNKDTVLLKKDDRFLVDDPDTPHKMCFILTKPLKIGRTYQNKGIFSFTLTECVATAYDNMELGIADYYRHFPDEMPNTPDQTSDPEPSEPIEDDGDDNGGSWL